jgi:hypothetical protein
VSITGCPPCLWWMARAGETSTPRVIGAAEDGGDGFERHHHPPGREAMQQPCSRSAPRTSGSGPARPHVVRCSPGAARSRRHASRHPSPPVFPRNRSA